MPQSAAANPIDHAGPPLRGPAAVVAAAVAVGVASDRWLGISLAVWLAAAAGAVLLWLLATATRRRRALASIPLFAALACVGGARHHVFWSQCEPNDIRLFAREEAGLVRIVGTIDSTPALRLAEPNAVHARWSRVDRTSCLLACREIRSAAGATPVTGTARLNVDGHLLHVEVDDEVEVTGWLSRPRGPSNPGESDSRDFLRSQGAGCALFTDHPDAVRRLGGERPLTMRRVLSRLRSEAEGIFVQRMSREQAPIASALLLGDRSGLTDEVRDAFARSGMMHVLAISGLNVGILAALVWPFCRLLNMSPWTTAVVMIAVVVGYTCLTDAAAPVMRATILITIVALSLPVFRAVSPVNALGLAALVLLLWRPGDLFDVGAQLSFLSVAAMIWVGTVRFAKKPDTAGPQPERTPLVQGALRLGSLVKDGYLLMGAIWLFTLPLTVHRFHLVSLVAVVINVILAPLVTVVMWLGYLTLMAGLIVPRSAVLFAPAFDKGLGLFVWIIEKAAIPRLGHVFIPGPPAWWVVGYYVILAVAVLGMGRFGRRPAWRALGIWTVAGLAIGLLPARPDGLRCTFLSVGHGLAVLIETPNGGTLLYDAGSIQSADRARWAVQHALWERRHARIDAVVISHADIDHFNAVPGLIRSVTVGRILTARPFLDFRQPSVVECCDAAGTAGVPIRLITENDRLLLDPEVTLRILHPRDDQPQVDDNANSVVLLVEYRGRRILLTGDLEKAGLLRLLNSGPLDVDVLQSPHHGSLAANPKTLADWSQPEYVVASSGREVKLDGLRRSYRPETEVLATSQVGAVTVSVTPDGRMAVVTHRGLHTTPIAPAPSSPEPEG